MLKAIHAQESRAPARAKAQGVVYKIKALFRKAKARTIKTLWRIIDNIYDLFYQDECVNFNPIEGRFLKGANSTDLVSMKYKPIRHE